MGMKRVAKTIISLALSLNLGVASAAGLAYNPELLISRFASWGIDPDKHLASINLKDSWSRFKKNKEIRRNKNGF
jgi:hypothetical protein